VEAVRVERRAGADELFPPLATVRLFALYVFSFASALYLPAALFDLRGFFKLTVIARIFYAIFSFLLYFFLSLPVVFLIPGIGDLLFVFWTHYILSTEPIGKNHRSINWDLPSILILFFGLIDGSLGLLLYLNPKYFLTYIFGGELGNGLVGEFVFMRMLGFLLTIIGLIYFVSIALKGMTRMYLYCGLQHILFGALLSLYKMYTGYERGLGVITKHNILDQVYVFWPAYFVFSGVLIAAASVGEKNKQKKANKDNVNIKKEISNDKKETYTNDTILRQLKSNINTITLMY